MSEVVFKADYADAYDRLYSDKDYDAECDLLEESFRRYGDGRSRSVLDLGCGTGNHAIPLALRGYEVTGADISADMLEHARSKARLEPRLAGRKQPQFFLANLRELDLGRRFDVVLMMFAVLGYQKTNAEVMAALEAVRKHLRPGGLFICDVWYGPAVLSIRPGERVKIVDTEAGQVIRAAMTELDTFTHAATVKYRVWNLKDGRLASQTEESHQMRFFYPQELALFFSVAGLRQLALCSFGNLDTPASEVTWNVLSVSTANS